MIIKKYSSLIIEYVYKNPFLLLYWLQEGIERGRMDVLAMKLTFYSYKIYCRYEILMMSYNKV